MTIAALILSLYASAHVGDVIDTLDVQIDASGSGQVHIEASYGLLTVENDDATWVCHEAVTAPNVFAAPDYVQGISGRWAARNGLVDGRDGTPVWTSTDLCDWSPVGGLDGMLVADIDIRGDTLWAATASSGVSNGLFRAEQGQFVPTAATADAGTLFLSVNVRGPAIWAVSTTGDELALWHSLDEGETFTTTPLTIDPELTRPLRATLGAVHPTEPQHAWLLLDPIGADLILETEDAGSTLTTLYASDNNLTDFARADDGRLSTVVNDREVFTNASGTFEKLDQPDAAGIGADGNRTWFSHRTFVSRVLYSVADDGVSTTASWGTDIISAAKSCPVDSDQATICAPLFQGLADRIAPRQTADTGMPPTPPTVVIPEPPRSCGCSSSGGLGWMSVVVALPVLLRRRATPQR